MAVNLSPWQIKDPQLVTKVRLALASSGVDPDRLTLEITETALVEESHATLARLRELKALGMRLSIDDFGTGYSSLSYLRQFPMDGVKIAKPFVDHVAEGEDDSALARAIITIGETLDLEVIAEGIEQEEQMRELRKLGCKLGQGYYPHARCPPSDCQLLGWPRGPRRAPDGQPARAGRARRQSRRGRTAPARAPGRAQPVVDALVVRGEEVRAGSAAEPASRAWRPRCRAPKVTDPLLPEVVGVAVGPVSCSNPIFM